MSRGKLLVPDHVKRKAVGAPRPLEPHEMRALQAMHAAVWQPVMLAACPDIRIRLDRRSLVQWHLFSRGYLRPRSVATTRPSTDAKL